MHEDHDDCTLPGRAASQERPPIDVERLAEALDEEFDFDDMVMGASPEKSAARILARLSRAGGGVP